MNRLQSAINWVAVFSQVSHVFCCGIPIVFSLLSLLSGIGIVATIPLGVNQMHEFMHDYELPMIIASGSILVLGWGLHFIAQRIDCRQESGCSHEPCASKKKRSSKILMLATFLFVFNVVSYFLLHH